MSVSVHWVDKPIAFVIDDDDVDRESIAKALKNHGYRVQTYATAESFLRSFVPEQAGCIVLDINLPGLSGTELQAQLFRRQIGLPILFVSGLVDISMATQAMRLGAIDVMEKPVEPEKLIAMVNRAFEFAIATKQSCDLKRDVQAAIKKLTPKELSVMRCLLDGLSMKEIAEHRMCSIATVARCQSSILEKMDSPNTTHLAIKMHKADARRHAAGDV